MLKMKRKGQLTIGGIMGILLSLMFLAMTLPIQIQYINIMLNATENDTLAQLAIVAIIPFELFMMLSAVVYAGRSVHEKYEDWRYR